MILRRSICSQSQRDHRESGTSRPHGDVQQGRRGSTLMIVVVLLGMLSVLGVLFFTFSNQERSNAEYYAEAAKIIEAPGLTADQLMDHALEQLIIGPQAKYKNSVLWGKRHSLIANTAGLRDLMLNDRTLYNGQVINVAQDPSATDQWPYIANADGSAASGALLDNMGNQVYTSRSASNIQDLLGMVDSPAANQQFERQTGRFPQPDVGYTYPDINNTFLAYNAMVRDRNNPAIVRHVIIPSFHRPQLYRDRAGTPYPLWEDFNYNNSIDSGEDRNSSSSLDAGSSQGNRQFRAHPDHVYVPSTNRGGSQVSRYIRTAADAQNLLGDGKRVFPFLPMYQGYHPTSDGSTVTLTDRPPTWIGHQGLWSGPHISDSSYTTPTLSAHDEYQYDVDNDGDGINEGIWMDLDFPVQELPDGTLYVPMFSYTVYDMDGLFNLNAHGNVQNLLFGGARFNNATNSMSNSAARFGTRLVDGSDYFDFISASNLGVHAAEVNPAWGLTGRAGIDSSTGIGTVFDQHRSFFGNLPFNASTLSGSDQYLRLAYQETANMELAFLKFGRPQVSGSSVNDVFAGLYGEESLIANNFSGGANVAMNFPRPGETNNDDNGDLNDGMEYSPQFISGTVNRWLDVDQPTDMTGIGTITATGSVKQLDRANPGSPSSRVQWQRYSGYGNNGKVQWGNTTLQSGNLMQNSQAYGLFDDPDEVALYAEDNREVDAPFTADDAAFLAMSNTDLTSVGINSRLEDLASFNFSTNENTNARGASVRKRFTTQGNDRKNYSLPRPIGITGRFWEWNDDSGQTSASTLDGLRFPPKFSGAARYANTDPFRSPVRYLLEATQHDMQTQQFQRRLAVNQLLVFDWQNPTSNQLVYRDLTRHPASLGNTPIPTTAPAYQSTYPWANAASQEYWARRDRQMLARDIYVMLYLLGAASNGDASNNPLTTPGATLYTDKQLEQMAQFAVNLVDAQDKDNVITRFEYDRDLSNGWNLDDNPYTTSGETDRREVWGVEKQELVFSEFLAFQTAVESTNKTETAHDDSEERQFICLELRNMAPYNIRFDDTAAWQICIRRYDPDHGSYNPQHERRLTLKSGTGTVNAGEFFTIFSTDRNEPSANPSAFRVDPDGSGIQWIVPRDSNFAATATGSSHHIDLVQTIAANPSMPPLEITDGDGTDLLTGSGTEGALLTIGTPATGGGTGNFVLDTTTPVEIVLRRRAHVTRDRPSSSDNTQQDDNPWVEVDRARIPATSMPRFDYPDSGMDATGQLGTLQSWQRAEPLSRVTQQPSVPGNAKNTFASGTNAENTNSTSPRFRVHQLHYDRPIQSLGELLDIPVVGYPPEIPPVSGTRPDGLTSYLSSMNLPPVSSVSGSGQYDSTDASGTYYGTFAKTAGAMFLQPNHPTQGDTNDANEQQWDNRWYRILEFLEVPTRQNRNMGIGTEFEVGRVAGRVNLNMIRHPEVLAGLIDNEQILDFSLTNANLELPQMLNKTDSTNPDWFEQFQNSRDPQDPYWSSDFSADLRLPGTPNVRGATLQARPFRSLASADAGADSLQHTILRHNPLDVSQTSHRHLFEIGTHDEHNNPAGSTNFDAALRHQVISKIWNNSTVRSNSFAVFISVKLFRAAVDSSGNIRIGGPLKEYEDGVEVNPELPEYRGVFIVDRSLIEKGVSTSASEFSDFRPFVTSRRILKEE